MYSPWNYLRCSYKELAMLPVDVPSCIYELVREYNECNRNIYCGSVKTVISTQL